MPVSLHDISVGSTLQTLDALAGVLDKALAHFGEKKIDLAVILASRLYPVYAAVLLQEQSAASHAGATVEALKSGAVSPPGPRPEHGGGMV